MQNDCKLKEKRDKMKSAKAATATKGAFKK